MKLDLSKFKKIQQDQSSTMLRSVDGHEIKVAHAALSPRFRDELAALPLHAAGGAAPVEAPLDAASPATAEGKGPFDGPEYAHDRFIPPTVDVTGAVVAPEDARAPEALVSQLGPAAGPYKNLGGNGAPAEPPPGGDTDTEGVRPRPKGIPPPPEHKAGQDVMPGGDVMIRGARPVPTPAQHNAEDAMLAQDITLGKITPETYQSLYAKQDTLGQIGTLFGLLVAGAGSGLTGQPNAVLHMMDKTLERDLDAQKSSNANAQNWYNLSLQHELQQQATIPQAQATTAAQWGAAYHSAVEGAFTESRIKALHLPQPVDLSAADAAKNRMAIASTVGYLQNQVNKQTPGPGRDAAQAALTGQVIPAVTAQVNANNVKRSARAAASAAQNPAPAPKQQGAINYDLLNQYAADAQNYSSMGMPIRPGMMTPGDVTEVQKEAKDIEDNRVAAQAYAKAFNVLWSHKARAAVDKNFYETEVATQRAQIARETAGRFNMTEADSQTGGMFPNWKDLAGSGELKFNNSMDYFKGQEEKATTLKRFPKLMTPFPTFKSPFEQKQQFQEGQTGTMKDGKTKVIFRNGQWQKAQ